MTEPFRVPEPSEAALSAFSRAWCVPHLNQSDWLRAAYAVDVPALCRQVEAVALDDMTEMLWDLFERSDISEACHNWIRARLATRFPEAAPELIASCCHAAYVEGCAHCAFLRPHIDRLVTPQPSAEPKPADPPPLPPGFPKTTFDEKTGCYTTDFGALAGMFTPSAGERCQRPHFGVPGTCELPKGHSGRCVIPTPNEGQRKNPSCAYCDGTGLSEGGNGRKNVCLPCRGTGEHVRPDVPTPSAGEECPRCREKGGRHSVQCEAMTATLNQRIAEDRKVGVSAGETKCVHGRPRNHCCAHGVEGDCAWCKFEKSTAPAVGARPEEGSVTTTRCRTCKEWYIDKAKHACRCTACACQECTADRRLLGSYRSGITLTPAERDFLRALAEAIAAKDVRSVGYRLEVSENLVPAARRVVEEAARRVTA